MNPERTKQLIYEYRVAYCRLPVSERKLERMYLAIIQKLMESLGWVKGQ